MAISILGCGWYGQALGAALIGNGYYVKGSTTSPGKLTALAGSGITPYLVNFKTDEETYDAEFFACDVLVISIPPRTRHGEGNCYLPKIQRIIAAAVCHGVKNVIYISSTAVYGESCTEVTERDIPKPDTTTGEMLLQAENLFDEKLALKTAIIRFGGLVGPGRHPGRFFAGKKNIPNGRAPVNLIHLDDCIGITLAVIKQDLHGLPINAVSPHHPYKSNFYKRASSMASLAQPEFIDELGNWKIINSNVVPEVLSYSFKVPNWDDYDFT